MHHFPSLNDLMRMHSRTLITIHRAHITSSRLPTVVVVVVMIRAPMFGIKRQPRHIGQPFRQPITKRPVIMCRKTSLTTRTRRPRPHSPIALRWNNFTARIRISLRFWRKGDPIHLPRNMARRQSLSLSPRPNPVKRREVRELGLGFGGARRHVGGW